jgi:hypothetical protein
MKLNTSRITALLYLGLAVAGAVSFLYANQKLFVEGDALATSSNLVGNEGLARFGIAVEMALVVFQALVAVWFYKLFRKKDTFVAGLIAIFGMVNAIAIMIASAMWLSSLNAAIANQPEQSLLLYNLHENIWLVSSLFFGLWLIPMGYAVKLSKMPVALAWILILGGTGYILSAFISILLPEQSTLTELLPFFATIGELWIIGYLLIKPLEE